ncbi:ABC transporter ATP-binding protein [Nesterenkonia flava]|uniref:ABC transporter ATP-binding protein n=1 Tax=Nesterenkonia flava TaxID=469799 RepID=A0ABU1FQB2_9MICC|nr:ABC transporter ATP-binding protein [Nesterenkonia flava]MDR5710552.1 ABC transporter ATP-binding protein [Nesterenkonia flava]
MTKTVSHTRSPGMGQIQPSPGEAHGQGKAPREAEPLLVVTDLVQEYATRGAGGVKTGTVHALSGVSFELFPGETLGIVGETGSGKSTLARAIIQVEQPVSGSVEFQGKQMIGMSKKQLRATHAEMQMVYQDPFGSLNPRWKVADVIAEPMLGHTTMSQRERQERVEQLLELVGLDPAIYCQRRPIELSGGQAQRVAIARAVALKPALIICDEAISSLDVLIQAQVLNLFEELRQELDLAYLFIAHDLATVKQISDSVAVMHLGQLAEIGPAEEIYAAPRHPYTRALLDSIPILDIETGEAKRPVPLKGDPPSPLDPPSGCRFRTRCPLAQDICAEVEPRPAEVGDGTGRPHKVACHFPLEPGQMLPDRGARPQAAAAAA